MLGSCYRSIQWEVGMMDRTHEELNRELRDALEALYVMVHDWRRRGDNPVAPSDAAYLRMIDAAVMRVEACERRLPKSSNIRLRRLAREYGVSEDMILRMFDCPRCQGRGGRFVEDCDAVNHWVPCGLCSGEGTVSSQGSTVGGADRSAVGEE